MEVKKERSELWKQKNILIWIQLCTLLIHVRHSPTHTQVLNACSYRQLLRVRVYTDTRFSRTMINVIKLLFVRTEPNTQILRVSAVYGTMETKECFKFWKQKNIFFLQLGNEIGELKERRFGEPV